MWRLRIRNLKARYYAGAVLAAIVFGRKAWREMAEGREATEVAITTVAGLLLVAVFVYLASRDGKPS